MPRLLHRFLSEPHKSDGIEGWILINRVNRFGIHSAKNEQIIVFKDGSIFDVHFFFDVRVGETSWSQFRIGTRMSLLPGRHRAHLCSSGSPDPERVRIRRS